MGTIGIDLQCVKTLQGFKILQRCKSVSYGVVCKLLHGLASLNHGFLSHTESTEFTEAYIAIARMCHLAENARQFCRQQGSFQRARVKFA